MTQLRAPMDLSQLISEFAFASEERAVQAIELENIESKHAASVQTETAAIAREGELAGQVKLALDQIHLERAAKNKEAAAFFGVNTEASNSIVQEMARGIISQHGELKQSAQQIAARQAQNFADDPMTWLYDQFALPYDVAAHNTKVAVMEKDLETLQKLGDLADKQIARNNAIDANTTAQISAMEAERLKQVATRVAEDAKQKAMSFNLQTMSVRSAQTAQEWQALMQLHNAEVQLQQLDMSKEQLQLSKEQKELSKKNLQLLIDQRTESAESMKRFQVNLDRATAITGMRRIDAREWDRLPNQTKIALSDVMSNPYVEKGRLGSDPVDAVRNADGLNAPLTPQLQEIKARLHSWAAEVHRDPLFASKKPEEKAAAINALYNTKVKAELNNIPDSGGIYSAPSMGSVGKIPMVANTILWKSTFSGISAAQPRAVLSAQGVYDAALSLVVGNKMDLERAAGEIAIIYKSVVQDNHANRDFNRFALPIQNSYRTSISTGSAEMFGGSVKVIDMSNPTEVKNALLRAVAANKVRSISGRELNVPPLGEKPVNEGQE